MGNHLLLQLSIPGTKLCRKASSAAKRQRSAMAKISDPARIFEVILRYGPPAERQCERTEFASRCERGRIETEARTFLSGREGELDSSPVSAKASGRALSAAAEDSVPERAAEKGRRIVRDGVMPFGPAGRVATAYLAWRALADFDDPARAAASAPKVSFPASKGDTGGKPAGGFRSLYKDDSAQRQSRPFSQPA